MTAPISLAAARESRDRPNANCVKRDDDWREMQLYALHYTFADRYWLVEMWAYSQEDAEARSVAMRKTLHVDGQVYAVIPR